ncbi:MAG TPA: L-histidine N(alpha)-methyltransferase [Polyangiales bacterium]|nr:L-histidine N(alpha)-methyltransferase [Polyangiales bacterium]
MANKASPAGPSSRSIPISARKRAPSGAQLRTRLQFRNDVLAGLRSRPRRLQSVYFYDDVGSTLFEEITRLPEYYLTRTEHSILTQYAEQIVSPVLNEPACVVDLGAGDGNKTRILLEHLHSRGADVRYAPVDVSAAALWDSEQRMQADLPWLRVDPIHDDYIAGLSRVRAAQQGRKLLVLWLGSSIGNFTVSQATQMLHGLAGACDRSDTLLIGFDLLKDPSQLVAAYADSQGVTTRFNFNLLERINRELDGDFDPREFVHHATFVPDRSAMESYLLSRRRQVVSVAGERFELEAWEPIQTETSYKYSDRQIESLLVSAGLVRCATYRDADGWFADVVCRPQPGLAS